MKKLFYMITALFLFMQMTAFSYSDIQDSKLSNAAQTLSGFGIINGYEDGSFRPNNNITRAKFAKIITLAANIENNMPTEYGSFTDMNGAEWAEEYIYIAKSLNIINGTEPNHFEPESHITYEQAIKMIVAALGYGEEAERAGGYPTGYIAQAKQLNITDGIVYAAEDYATRGNIALMIENALQAPCYNIWLDEGSVQRQKADLTLSEQHKIMQELDKVQIQEPLPGEWDNDSEIGVG